MSIAVNKQRTTHDIMNNSDFSAPTRQPQHLLTALAQPSVHAWQSVHIHTVLELRLNEHTLTSLDRNSHEKKAHKNTKEEHTRFNEFRPSVKSNNPTSRAESNQLIHYLSFSVSSKNPSLDRTRSLTREGINDIRSVYIRANYKY